MSEFDQDLLMTPETFSLEGKVAVVTGGYGTLGSVMARGLSQFGCKVAVLGRNREKGKLLVDQIKAAGGDAIVLEADVVDQSELESASDQLLSAWGKLDILVNAAGGNKAGAVVMPDQKPWDVSIDDLQQVFELNQLGTILPSLVFARAFEASASGVIINISSMAAPRGITRVLGYSTAKAGVDNFTKWMAVEMASKFGDGIRVNAIAPGFFVAEQNRDLLLNQDGSMTDRGQKIIANTPMGRFGQPEELVGTLIWLSSPASKFVTGSVIPVDGGFNAYGGV